MKFLSLFVTFATFVIALSAVPVAFAAAIAHWSFDETSGSTAADGIGGFDGVQNGGTVDLAVAGRFNTAAQFPGNAWFNVPNVTGWRTGDFTVATWVKLDSTSGNQTVFAKWWNPWEFRFEVGNGAGSDLRNASNQTFVTGSTPVGDTDWHHVAWVWTKSAGTMEFYKDGNLTGTFNGTPNQDVRNTSSGLNIGRKGDTNNNLQGTLDELWVYNEALNIEQINGLRVHNIVSDSTSVVLGGTDFVDVIGANETQNSWTERVTLSNLNGDSVTFDLTLTNAASKVFSRRDGNGRFAIGTSSDGNGIDANEDLILTASLVSSSQFVDVDSIGFNLTGMGLRSLSGQGVGEWTSSLTSSPLAIGGNGSDLAIALDDVTQFHLLNGSDYTGLFNVTGGMFQLTDLSPIDGLQYSVTFNVIPEPASYLLAFVGSIGLAGLGWRRRRLGLIAR